MIERGASELVGALEAAQAGDERGAVRRRVLEALAMRLDLCDPEVVDEPRADGTPAQRAAAALAAETRQGVVDADGHRWVVIGLHASAVVGRMPAGAPLPGPELETAARLARAVETAARRADSQETADHLVEVGLRLASSGSLDEILTGLVESARHVLRARYAALGVLAKDGRSLERFITSGVTADERRDIGPEPTGRGILGLLISDPRPVRIDDLAADPRACGMPPRHPPMTTFLGVPVQHGGEVFGNLYLTDKQGPGGFSETDERIALTLAAQAAVAITNQRRLTAESRARGQLESVHEVAGALLATVELGELLPLIVRRAQSLCGATVAVGLGDHALSFPVAVGDESVHLGGLSTPTAPDACAAELRRLLPGTDVDVHPLGVEGGRRGVLAAVSRAPIDDAARYTLSLFARQATVALANAEAYEAERRRLGESARLQAAEARAAFTAEAMQRAIDAQEAERARIARELHDEAGQSLTALALALRMLDGHVDDTGRERLAELRHMVNGISGSLRTLATELRPSGLREHGLASAIERQAARATEASGIEIDTVVSGEFGDLPDPVQVALLRMVQEAITNVVRHSRARRASVLVSRRHEHLRAVVEDDGQGFDPAAPTDRLGLAGIRERVGLLGGELRIESSPGEGTAVIIDVEGVRA